MIVGTEWLIEAAGCNEAQLRDESLLRELFERVMQDLGLKAVGSVWHKFPGEGGVTGLIALTESHLACHTYPEHRTATFNLYCCRTRPEWDWESNLKSLLDAGEVSVTKIERGDAAPEISNLESRTAAAEGRIQQSEVRNPKSKIGSAVAEGRIQQSKIQNPKSKIASGGDA
jgi:S-adenosylmethionine decarboxylase